MNGPWEDTSAGALAAGRAALDLDADVTELSYIDGYAWVPLDPAARTEVHGSVVYSETRDQYRLVAWRGPRLERS